MCQIIHTEYEIDRDKKRDQQPMFFVPKKICPWWKEEKKEKKKKEGEDGNLKNGESKCMAWREEINK